MTAAEPPPVPAPTSTCGICGAPVAPDAPRCPACGLMVPAARGRQVVAQKGLWVLGAALVALYVFVLLVVIAAR